MQLYSETTDTASSLLRTEKLLCTILFRYSTIGDLDYTNELFAISDVNRAKLDTNCLRTPRNLTILHISLTFHRCCVQISEKFKMKVENNAKIPKYNSLAF